MNNIYETMASIRELHYLSSDHYRSKLDGMYYTIDSITTVDVDRFIRGHCIAFTDRRSLIFQSKRVINAISPSNIQREQNYDILLNHDIINLRLFMIGFYTSHTVNNKSTCAGIKFILQNIDVIWCNMHNVELVCQHCICVLLCYLTYEQLPLECFEMEFATIHYNLTEYEDLVLILQEEYNKTHKKRCLHMINYIQRVNSSAHVLLRQKLQSRFVQHDIHLREIYENSITLYPYKELKSSPLDKVYKCITEMTFDLSIYDKIIKMNLRAPKRIDEQALFKHIVSTKELSTYEVNIAYMIHASKLRHAMKLNQ